MKTMMRRSSLFATLATAALAATAAQAGEAPGKLVISGYTATADTTSGALLAAHDYAAVIGRLAPHGAAFTSDEVASSTNLCVAYAATHRMSEARQACDEAVRLAQSEPSGMTLAEHKAHQEAVALALANQAVADKLTAQTLVAKAR